MQGASLPPSTDAVGKQGSVGIGIGILLNSSFLEGEDVVFYLYIEKHLS